VQDISIPLKNENLELREELEVYRKRKAEM